MSGTENFSLRWVGRPGKEIATAPSDDEMAKTIESYAGKIDPKPESIVIPVDGQAAGWGRPGRAGPYGRAVEALASASEASETESVATAPRAELRSTLAVTPTPIAWRRPSFQR